MNFLQQMEARKSAQKEQLRHKCVQLGIEGEVFSPTSRYDGCVLHTTVFERSFIERFGKPDWEVFAALFRANPRECLCILDSTTTFSNETRWSLIEDKPQEIIALVEEARRVCPPSELLIQEGIGRHLTRLTIGVNLPLSSLEEEQLRYRHEMGTCSSDESPKA
jgi:hypothetical protein